MAMAPGERLRVLATDPKAPGDFRLYCAESGHRLVEESQDGAEFVLLLERAARGQSGTPSSVASISQRTTARSASGGSAPCSRAAR